MNSESHKISQLLTLLLKHPKTKIPNNNNNNNQIAQRATIHFGLRVMSILDTRW